MAGPTGDHSDRYSYLNYKVQILLCIKIPKSGYVALNTHDTNLITVPESFQVQNTAVTMYHLYVPMSLHVSECMCVCV